MQNLVEPILNRLQQYNIPGLNIGKDMIFPYYEGLSLVNLPSSICRLLNIPSFGAQALDDQIMNTLGGPYENVIFLLADGVRFDFFQSYLDSRAWKGFQSQAVFSPLTSITPSTTAAALTTLWTGRNAAEHGILGYEVWLREYGMIANMIMHSAFTFQGDVGGLQRAGFDPATFLPVPTMGPHMQQHGIESFALQHISIAFSGLSKMLFPGVEIVSYRSNADLFVSLEHLYEKQRGKRTYTYVYWETIDTLSHRYGHQDERNRREFELFSLGLTRVLENIRRRSKGRTLFILTADHGHIQTPILPRYDLNRYPEINRKLVMVPTGENRLPYLFPRIGYEQEVLDLFTHHFQQDFLPIRSQDAITKGLFGQGVHHPMLADRLGDWILSPQGNAYLWWWWQKENPLLGRHGGLSAEEMLVPFFATVL
jgi:predicted AlkP superfamily pyrophosphatase or phosphodiesterase